VGNLNSNSGFCILQPPYQHTWLNLTSCYCVIYNLGITTRCTSNKIYHVFQTIFKLIFSTLFPYSNKSSFSKIHQTQVTNQNHFSNSTHSFSFCGLKFMNMLKINFNLNVVYLFWYLLNVVYLFWYLLIDLNVDFTCECSLNWNVTF